jgi:SAM-dependent MidA family methyltransferase
MDLPTPTILAEVRRNGCISFARFMELALYKPGAGYYERAGNRIGRRGDYYTSVGVGSLFGELVAARFAAWLDEDEATSRMEFGQRSKLRIVEAGAHDGRLASDILTWLRSQRGEQSRRIEYWILEPSPIHRRWQEATLAGFGASVRWATDWTELGGVNGIIFSNELLDAMPVRRLVWSARDQTWREAVVIERDGNLEWSLADLACLPVGAEHLASLPRDLTALLPDGFTTEVSPTGVAWWREAAKALQSGRLVAFDYGLEAHEFLDPGRAGGTLRGYRNHQFVVNVLAAPGEQDLTAHVNFTAICSAGIQAGLQTESMKSQEEFLVQVAMQLWPGNDESRWTPARARQFRMLTHPQHLGRAFRVLVQRRTK